MAVYELQGEKLTVQVESLGAELKSLKRNSDGTEYMWNADPEYWKRTAPVLFPFIGRLKDQKYHYRGVTYEITPHGFARDMEFKLTEKNSHSLTFELRDTEETRKAYPFPFLLQLRYELDGNELKLKYLVKNTGNSEMYFSLGGHPGFNCPLPGTDEKRSDCSIGFKGAEPVHKLHCRNIDMNTGLARDTFTDYELKDGKMEIPDDLFKDDALVLENQINEVSLYGKNKKPYLTFHMDAPVYGIWSCVKDGSPFICIEPWYGRCDRIDFSGSLEEREFQNRLEPDEVFVSEYRLTIEEE